MLSSIAQKLKIKEGFTLLSVSAPKDFAKGLGVLPAGVTVSASAKKFDQVHWFVLNKTQFENELGSVLKLVKENMICWIYYPKGTSKIQTDLTRDKGWDALLKHNDTLTWISLISFDEIWSVFGFRLNTETYKKKAAQPKEREIFKYVDAKTKTIHLPDDFKTVLQKNKKEQAFFGTLSFTNKKEYVEWIVTAKREETRKQRIKESIEKLGKEWKTPRNL